MTIKAYSHHSVSFWVCDKKSCSWRSPLRFHGCGLFV